METGEARLAVVTLKLRMSAAPADARVDMGRALFIYCRDEGLITMEPFVLQGAGSRPHVLPAYLRRNIVLCAPELGDWEFRLDA